MTDIVQRIAKVVREHREELNEEGVCICGWTEKRDVDYPKHVAFLLAAELQLEEEWSDDIAGPEWARYLRYVTPVVTHHGPRYLESAEKAAGL